MPPKKRTTAKTPTKKTPTKRKQKDEEEDEVSDTEETMKDVEEPEPKKKEKAEPTPKRQRRESTKAKKEKMEEEEEEEEEETIDIRSLKGDKVHRLVHWKDLQFIGAEVADKVLYEQEWRFPELNEELVNGELSEVKFPIRLYMSTEPISKTEGDEKKTAINVQNVPVIFAIVCNAPDSIFSKLVVTSVQSSKEEVVDMKSEKMEWEPYMSSRRIGYNIPKKLPLQQLVCKKRNIDKLDDEKKAHHSQVVPYIIRPKDFEKESLEDLKKKVRNVSFTYKASTGKKFDIIWDKETDRIATGFDVYIEDEGLDEDEKPKMEAALRKAFENQRAIVEKAYNQRKEFVDAMGKYKEAVNKMRVYKFYPTLRGDADKLKGSKVPLINRYYHNAFKFFPVPKDNSINNLPTKANPGGPLSPKGAAAAPSTGFVMPPITAPVTGGFTFNSNADSTIKTDRKDAPSGFGSTSGSTGFVIPTGGFSIGTVTPSTTAPAVGGFFFNPNAAAVPTSGWKCAACEEQNDQSATSCKTCMSAKPK